MGTALAKANAHETLEAKADADATDCYKFPAELSPKQQTAISALVMGLSDERAADHAGVHRVTVTRWRLYDEAFQVVYLDRLADLWIVQAEHLRALIPKAIDTLHSALECGDDRARVRAAVEILRLADRASRRP